MASANNRLTRNIFGEKKTPVKLRLHSPEKETPEQRKERRRLVRRKEGRGEYKNAVSGHGTVKVGA